MRRKLIMILLLVLPLMSGRVAFSEDSLAVEVTKAVDLGVVYLKSKQLANGSWGGLGDTPQYAGASGDMHRMEIGICALSLHALLESAVPVPDPVITKGFYFLYNRGKNNLFPYEAAVVILAVESKYHASASQKRLKKLMKLPPEKRAAKEKKLGPLKVKYRLSKADKELVDDMLSILRQTYINDKGGWRYGACDGGNMGKPDTAATQYAILGFTIAGIMGFEVSDKYFRGALKFFLETQEKEGPVVTVEKTAPADLRSYVPTHDRARGWCYMPGSADPDHHKSNAGMTACGVCGLIMCKAILGKSEDEDDRKLAESATQPILDGLAWLGTNWSVSDNIKGYRSHYYYLYSLERIGQLGSVDTINGHDWYQEGAEYLVLASNEDGSWIDQTELAPEDIFGTAFALLFLRRGTRPLAVISRPE
ncbi:hypothetical protein ACFL54_02085 [Planctomycetota bacterium]